jgi:hypothetical protein
MSAEIGSQESLYHHSCHDQSFRVSQSKTASRTVILNPESSSEPPKLSGNSFRGLECKGNFELVPDVCLVN